jgi:hypothetical protein
MCFFRLGEDIFLIFVSVYDVRYESVYLCVIFQGEAHICISLFAYSYSCLGEH